MLRGNSLLLTSTDIAIMVCSSFLGLVPRSTRQPDSCLSHATEAHVAIAQVHRLEHQT